MQTTKQLILVRHAKSDWDDFSVSDHDRVLNERGRRDAPVMGQRILKQYGAPDLILSSTALRAKQTAQAIQAACLLPEEAIQFHSKLYHAGPQMITDHILETPDAVQRLLIVCHNPGITFLPTAFVAASPIISRPVVWSYLRYKRRSGRNLPWRVKSSSISIIPKRPGVAACFRVTFFLGGSLLSIAVTYQKQRLFTPTGPGFCCKFARNASFFLVGLLRATLSTSIPAAFHTA
ncbi:MAG: histidine phosphatase family protein [Bacteroidota bacterium]|nr:MAG: histidine phosphatase family protein [Bacteroidota bacterium]